MVEKGPSATKGPWEEMKGPEQVDLGRTSDSGDENETPRRSEIQRENEEKYTHAEK